MLTITLIGLSILLASRLIGLANETRVVAVTPKREVRHVSRSV